MRPLYIGSIGLLAVLIIVIIYFTFKTTPTGKCTGPTACADTWYASDGTTVVPAQQLCDPNTLQIAIPNFGPGQCASPCKPGETPYYSAATKAGHCVPAGKAPGCWGDADCGAGKCANIDATGMGTCACPPTYIGAHCESKGCTDSKICGKWGKCNAAGTACECTLPNLDPGSPGGAPPCTQCLPGWGPGGPTGACTFQWKTVKMLTNDCWYGDHSVSSCRADPSTNWSLNERGPKGEAGDTVPAGACVTSSGGACRCTSGVNTMLCSVTGWHPASRTDAACNDNYRDPSTYTCHPFSEYALLTRRPDDYAEVTW